MAELWPHLQAGAVVGKGATCKVVQYVDKRDASVYAVKVVDLHRAAADATMVRQVQREREALEALCAGKGRESPCLLRYFGSCKDESNLYFVLELLPGGTLAQRLRTPLGADDAKVYTRQVAEALLFMHQRGWIYRDLKANNVGFNQHGKCVLFDFGLAKKTDGQRTTTPLGVGHHVAPEIASGGPHGQEADWWSLGILIYEMLNGAPPFPYLFSRDPEDQAALKAAITAGVTKDRLSSDKVQAGPLSLVLSLLTTDVESRADGVFVASHEWVTAACAVPAPLPMSARSLGGPMGPKPTDPDPFANW